MYVDDYLAEPFRYDHGYLPVPTGPGLGVKVDQGRLQRLRSSG
jgi:L-alanine-DL-glutamate epimerase-like enolase superfamily enzyme